MNWQELKDRIDAHLIITGIKPTTPILTISYSPYRLGHSEFPVIKVGKFGLLVRQQKKTTKTKGAK